MFENVINFFKKIGKKDQIEAKSKDTAKERLHLVLMQDRANVSADFLELMKQEIIDVIKKYIEIDEKEIDVRLTNKENEDGTNGAPALYANIPILNIKNDARKIGKKEVEEKQEEKQQTEKVETQETQETKKQKNKENKKVEEKKKENKTEKKEKETEQTENKKEEEKEAEAQEKVQEIIEEVIEKSEEKEEIKSKK